MKYRILNMKDGFNYELFGPASFDECQKEYEENLETYRDHGYENVTIVETVG